MKLIIFSAFLLLGSVTCGPVTKYSAPVIDEDFFNDDFAIYTSENDIVKIYDPINALNFAEDDECEDVIIFFVEKDLNTGEDKGLYVRKGEKVKKLLDNGRDVTGNHDDSKVVYFAANDGIYVYKHEENAAEKYGSINDDLISIAIDNTSSILYVLNKNKELFKVTENGQKAVKINEVVNAEQIVMDYNNNLFYCTSDKKVYVINESGVKKIEEFNDFPDEVTLIRPPFIFDEGIPVVVDDKGFVIYPNGTIEYSNVELKVKPTAYSMEVTLIQYYAHNKKIYEYNVLAMLLSEAFAKISEFLNEKRDEIESIATRSRSNLRSPITNNRIESHDTKN